MQYISFFYQGCNVSALCEFIQGTVDPIITLWVHGNNGKRPKQVQIQIHISFLFISLGSWQYQTKTLEEYCFFPEKLNFTSFFYLQRFFIKSIFGSLSLYILLLSGFDLSEINQAWHFFDEEKREWFKCKKFRWHIFKLFIELFKTLNLIFFFTKTRIGEI